jgi:hypothetical protein
LQIIDDDDISCELPSWTPDANSNLVECFQQIVKQAMLSSEIARSFLTVKAREKSLIDKVKLIEHFDTRLRTWLDDLPTIFKLDVPTKAELLPRGIRIEHLLYLHLSYYGNMAAIHSVLGYPWNVTSDPEINSDNSAIKEQVASSDIALTEASKNIILVTRSISVDASTPTWYA